MRLAGMAFVAGDIAAARDAFQAYRTRYPNGRRIQQATYWAALSHLALGDSATARDLFQQTLRLDTMSYYGARAADRLGSTARFGTLAGAPARTPLPAAAADALDRVDLLREIGWDEAASFEMSGARSSFGTDQAGLYSLAEALNERGNTSAGISLGRELYRRAGAWNERLLRIVYPFPYRDIIMAEARRHGIDPFVAAGLIRQESMFNPRAVSPAGAIGLMQVMPQTGAALAPRLQVTGFTPDMLREPAVNVRLGMQFLADMIGRFDGRIDAVLAAYNAGPHRVERWQNFPEWRDVELFSERIPFEETRDYVKIVQQNARLYRALYGTTAAGP
jgi:soluble lytic murein transglycosylase